MRIRRRALAIALAALGLLGAVSRAALPDAGMADTASETPAFAPPERRAPRPTAARAPDARRAPAGKARATGKRQTPPRAAERSAPTARPSGIG